MRRIVANGERHELLLAAASHELDEVAAGEPVLRDVQRHGRLPRTTHRAEAVGDRRRLGGGRRRSRSASTSRPPKTLVVAHPVHLGLHRGRRGVDEQRDVVAGTALTWLAKPSSVWLGCTWLQIQLRVPGRAFSAISHGAVGTITPLANLVSTTAGPGGSAWRRARAGTRPLAPLPCGVGARGEPGGAERRELQEFAAVQRAARASESSSGAGSEPPSGGSGCTTRVYRSPFHPRSPAFGSRRRHPLRFRR